MNKKMKQPIVWIGVLALVLMVATTGAAQEPIVATVLDFVNGNVLLEEEGTGIQYELVPKPTMKYTGRETFHSGLRVEISSYTLDNTATPIKVYPAAVKELPSHPTYIGIVQGISTDESLLIQTLDGNVITVVLPTGVLATFFENKGIEFTTSMDVGTLAGMESVNARTCSVLEVYHGVLISEKDTIIEMQKNPAIAQNELPDKMRFAVAETAIHNADVQNGEACMVLFDPYTLLAYAIVPEENT